MDIPKYEGKPLSAIAPIPNVLHGFPQLWIYASLWEPLNLVESLDVINDLVADGWILGKYGSAATETQLYKTARVLKANETMDTWHKPDGDQQPVPVILAFSIPNPVELEPTGLQHIPMLNPLPLPQMGEFGLVISGEKEEITPYHILSLPLEARQRWVSLSEKLKELSSPLMWPGFTELHRVASNDIEYQRAVTSLSLKTQHTIGRTQANFLVQEAALKAARLNVERLLEMLKKPNWLEQWQEIQSMTRQLALDYLEHHLLQMQKIDSSLGEGEIAQVQDFSLEPPAITEQPKKKRVKRQKETVPLVSKGKETVTVRSDIINREIMNALRDKDGYIMHESQMVAEHKHRFYQKDRGQITITIKPLEGESFDTILHAVNTLGDGCVDTFIALQAIAIDKNGVEHIRTPFKISPDDILRVCGKKGSGGSYTPFQRAEVVKHLKTLSQAHVIATMPGKPKRGKREATVFKAEGALIDLLSWKIGEYKLITGEEVWEQRSVSIGEWVAMIPELSEQTAIMLRKLLAYSAKNQRYQKRLGLYISFMFRINAHKGTWFEISTEKLLEGSGIVPDKKNPGRFRLAIEDALEQLQRDNVIGSYERIIDASPEGKEHELAICQMGRGWWDYYNRQHWKFRAPERTIQQYKQLKKPDDTAENEL